MHTQTFVILIICFREDFFFHLGYVRLCFLTLKFSLEHDFEWFHKCHVLFFNSSIVGYLG